MEPVPRFVVYSNNEETAPPAIHHVINQDEVHLRKSENDFRTRRMEKESDGGSVSTH